jgi:dissimilatory sulfite reductase (desulfoviridin) alpha/beta subunit
MNQVTVEEEIVRITKRWVLRDAKVAQIAYIKYETNDESIEITRNDSSVFLPVTFFKEVSKIFNEIEKIKLQEIIYNDGDEY